ncbi:ABC-2 type transport system permease protein/ribosome-dependent ATPase [Hydrogenivirga caldilitoris]|uniref:ABC-2 type transport system permease protein/ribosome-dependent ATPase n=1 Tax=Hydrogenivirga caldilitoris TaxID=246264 RepID=A0A497XMX4_9AQUI|nr:ABC transporter permease [Hydrogenivirga caldilitoris]RLJ70306.1 ABC-2 type transport system permease protein/ribosome-dependent ATPase [Hydrogenivirga caldilitoris]
MRLHRVKAIYLKELKELARDRISRVVVLVVPLIITLLFGYGMSLDVENVPFVVCDEDKSALSREFVSKLKENREFFNFKGYVSSQREVEELLLRGKAKFGVVIPDSFGERLKEGKSANLQVLIDGTFPFQAEVSGTYVDAVANSFILDLIPHLREMPFSIDTRYWFNEELKQKHITSSGILAVVFTVSPAIFTAIIFSRERERGTIYNIYTSPVGRLEYLLGKQLLTLSVYTVNVLFLSLVVVFLFKVPFRGNYPFFFFATELFILTSSSIGMLVSTFLRTQIGAIVVTMIITIIPAFLYSGYLIPVSSMGREAYIEAHLFPTLYYMNIVKGSFLKGVGPLSLLKDTVAILFFYILFLSLSYIRFKKRER